MIQMQFDVRIRLKDWPTFPTHLPESSEVLYASSQGDTPDEPSLRVGVLGNGDYFGFFYSDGVRFAVERQGHEVWADWPENYTLEDACTYLLGPVIGYVLRRRGVTCLHASAVASVSTQLRWLESLVPVSPPRRRRLRNSAIR